jgi:hypothetical protein
MLNFTYGDNNYETGYIEHYIYDLSNRIINRPPQSRETIPLRGQERQEFGLHCTPLRFMKHEM